MPGLPLNSTNYKLPLAAYAAVWGTGFLSQTTSPHLIAALVASRDLDEVQAGIVQSAELAVISATALLLAPWIGRVSKRSLALTGALIAVGSHVMSALSTGYAELIVFRTVAGFGAGLALAAGNAVIAASAEPERVYGRMLMILGMASMMILVAMGYTAERWDTVGTYGFQAVWITLLMPLLWGLPTVGRAADGGGVGRGRFPLVAGVLIIVALGMFASGDIAIWSFAGQFAASLGMNSADSGWILGGGSVLAIFGGGVAAAFGSRWGYARPIALGLAVLALSAVIITSARVPLVFILAVIFSQGVYMFLLSYLYGVAGKLDPAGRVMVAAAGAALLGASVGPYVAGSLAAARGYPAIGHYFVLVSSVAMVLILVAVRNSNNRLR